MFDNFSLVCKEDILALMKEMPNKSCILDPLPTDLVKQCAESLVPLITHIINKSLLSGVVPSKLKEAVVVPLQVGGNSITILNSDIKIQESVKYLGVRLDQTLSMSSHISDVCRSSFLSLRRIGCIRPYLSDRAT